MVPRCNYRIIKEKYLIPFCKKNGVGYYQVGWIDCLKIVLRRFGQVAARLESDPDKDYPTSPELIMDLLNCYG